MCGGGCRSVARDGFELERCVVTRGGGCVGCVVWDMQMW